MACRTIGECRFGGHIDNEFGDGMEPGQSTVPKQFTYVRYDPDVTTKGLGALGLGDIKAENVQVMDSVAYVNDIRRVGKAFADSKVSLKHFGTFEWTSQRPTPVLPPPRHDKAARRRLCAD
jgi:hypothetical protein